MNSSSKILLVSGIIGFAMLVGGCAKKKQPESAYTRIQGKWVLAKTGSDDNLNGLIDGYERAPVPAEKDYQMVFTNEGKGVTSSTFDGKKDPDLTFNWQIVYGDSLRIIYAANDTMTYHISSVSASELFLQRQGDITLEWLYFVKR